ncbi:MAG TPA: prolipoprotein diacylglyceryl transferase [Thermotogota bacterium]|nr:prolipoprotein diacylglyceryl transferase [Thermotogota bacterium]HRW91465.1 prolipoprotein diacylglyceryl transferase [Thermotogota bacterium]
MQHKKRWIWWVVLVAGIVGAFFFLRANFRNDMFVHPVLFSVGPFQIHWYGVIIATGIIISYLIGRRYAIAEGIEDEHIAEGIIIGVFSGIVGARLWYVFSRWEVYSGNLSEIFMTWHGGMAIHGGVLGGMLGVFLYTRLRKKCSFGYLQAFDIASMMFPLAQGIGRWGNFFNHEAYGGPTDLPWKMYVPPLYRMPGFEGVEYFHPTFLYESIWNFCVFAFLLWYYKTKRKNFGEVLGLYLVLYSLARFFIEGLRLDSLWWGPLRAAQVTSVILIAIGIALFVWARKKGKKAPSVSVGNGNGK